MMGLPFGFVTKNRPFYHRKPEDIRNLVVLTGSVISNI